MSIALKNLTLILPSLGFQKVGFRLHFQKYIYIYIVTTNLS